MSLLDKAGRRFRESLSTTPTSKIVSPRVTKLAKATLYAEHIDNMVDPGKRDTIPKLGDQISSSISTSDRISPDELERAYRVDELVFGIINKYITVMVGSGFIIRSDNEKLKKDLEEWCKNSLVNQLLRDIIRDLFVFGYSFTEKVYNKGGDKIVRLASIDVKTMDFKRDAFSNIIVDKWGVPEGFYQQIYKIPDGSITKDPVDRKKIAYFRFFTSSGEMIGLSPVESLYSIITWRKNVDWAMGEGSYSYAAPPIIVNIGDKDNPPTQDVIDNASKEISNIGSQSVFVFPWHTKITRLDASRGMDELVKFSDNYKVAICNALMIPPSLMGVGALSGAGRSVDALAEEWERTVQGLQLMISEQLEAQVLRPLAEQMGYPKKSQIEIAWRSMSPAIALSNSRRRSTYARAGLLSWSLDAENQIREEEGLPLLTGPPVPNPSTVKGAGASGIDGTSVDDIVSAKVKKAVNDSVNAKKGSDEEDEME